MLIENIDAFLVDFGTDAVIGGETVRGIFDSAYAEAFGLVAGTTPVLIVHSDVGASVGDAVTVLGSDYLVAEVHPDGTGISRLVLEIA